MIINSKDVSKGIKSGKMKTKIENNIMVVELIEGRIYEGKILTKNGVWRKFIRFNDVNLNSALQYAKERI